VIRVVPKHCGQDDMLLFIGSNLGSNNCKQRLNTGILNSEAVQRNN